MRLLVACTSTDKSATTCCTAMICCVLRSCCQGMLPCCVQKLVSLCFASRHTRCLHHVQLLVHCSKVRCDAKLRYARSTRKSCIRRGLRLTVLLTQGSGVCEERMSSKVEWYKRGMELHSILC